MVFLWVGSLWLGMLVIGYYFVWIQSSTFLFLLAFRSSVMCLWIGLFVSLLGLALTDWMKFFFFFFLFLFGIFVKKVESPFFIFLLISISVYLNSQRKGYFGKWVIFGWAPHRCYILALRFRLSLLKFYHSVSMYACVIVIRYGMFPICVVIWIAVHGWWFIVG